MPTRVASASAARVLSPVTTGVPRRFPLHTMEALPASEVPLGFGTATISLIEVARWTSGPSYGVLLRVGGRVVAYSGLTDGIDPLLHARGRFNLGAYV